MDITEATNKVKDAIRLVLESEEFSKEDREQAQEDIEDFVCELGYRLFGKIRDDDDECDWDDSDWDEDDDFDEDEEEEDEEEEPEAED